MPTSQPDVFDPEVVRGYLGQTLANSTFAEERVDDHYLPILILDWSHVRAGFAFSNGSIETSYGALYQGFKQLYARDKAKWDNRDRAFVFCVRPEAAHLDRFCSSVETDVYFCRKFVVALVDPIGKALSRLPFLPLSPIEGEHPLRPPSAQNLLKSYGMPAMLASAIVVPGQGAETIVERCKEGQYGVPILEEGRTPARIVGRERDRESVVIDSLAIENFRAYRERQVFELGSGVTVLYGPNGFGKTSFFDALDFAVTGGIGRIEGRNRQLGKLARHLDSGRERSEVTLRFRSGGSSLRGLTRSVDDPNHAHLDGRTVDRKMVLRTLTGNPGEASEHVGNLVNLFRATHIFSQEQQELTKTFDDDCLPGETVTRMLAFEDYAAATAKLRQVCSLLRLSIERAHDDERDRREEIERARRELADYRVSLDSTGQADQLTQAVAHLRRFLTELKINDCGPTPSVEELRRLRGRLELLIRECDSRIDRLTQVVPLVPRRVAIRRERDEAKAKVDHLVAQIEPATGRVVQLEEGVRQFEEEFNKCAALRQACEATLDAVLWCRSGKDRYLKLTGERDGASVAIQASEAENDGANRRQEQIGARLASLADALSTVEKEIADAGRPRARYESLAGQVSTWRRHRARLEAIGAVDRENVARLASLREEAEQILEQRAEAESEHGRLIRALEQIDAATGDLRQLLIDIQQHVQSSSCPVCGAEHDSKEELLRKISARVEFDPGQKEREALARVRDRRRTLDQGLGVNAEQVARISRDSGALATERRELEASIADFVGAAEGASLVLTSPIESPEDRIQTRLREIADSREALLALRTNALQERETAQKEAAEVAALLAHATVQISAHRKTLSRANGELRTLLADDRAKLAPLDTSESGLATRESEVRAKLEGIERQRLDLEKRLGDARSVLQQHVNDLEALKRRLKTTRTEAAKLQTESSRIEEAVAAAAISDEPSENLITGRIDEQTALRGRLATARDSATALEAAIDAATTSASHDRLRRNIQTKEEGLAHAVSARDDERPWLELFERAAGIVDSRQRNAIAAFTTEYGPRASIIQRRLRPVYGFEDVEVRSEGTAIMVRVHRGDEELRPTEYFSQSQVQTLLLSLFLTACVSQTWSSLSPIFLDDPITHFDDLNTYAFLDLIVGLLEVEGSGRQFVLSTCDEKFLQLSRQKFRHLGEAVKFYQFSAIGAEGPVVSQV
jgi:exonuclease SbcC